MDTDGDGIIDRADLSRIYVYDNNWPENTDRYIEINTTANTYSFVLGKDELGNNIVWSGISIYFIPSSVWRNERTMPGLSVLGRLLNVLVVGDADGLYSAADGGQWGFRPDGSVVDAMAGARAFGPLTDGNTTNRNVMLFYSTTNPPPSVQINVRGPQYIFHAANSGIIFQLEQNAGVNGDQDAIVLCYSSDSLSSLRYTPPTHGKPDPRKNWNGSGRPATKCIRLNRVLHRSRPQH